MADEKKTEKKSAAKAAPKTAKAEKAPKVAAKAAAKEVPAGPTCTADKCKQVQRAKGYCRKHYMAWRRGDFGKKHRYVICSKEACRKPAVLGGRCAEHKKGAAAPAAA